MPKYSRDVVAKSLALSTMSAVAVTQILYFWIVSDRGLDLTDEGFYILNFRYWHVTPISSAFGAYFAPIFDLFGESVVATRWFGYTLVLLSTAGLGLSLIRWNIPGASGFIQLSAAVAGIVLAPMFQFLIPHPLTPSYNTLAYITAASSLAIAVHILVVARKSGRVAGGAFFAWGAIVSVALLNKFSAGGQIWLWQGALLVYGVQVLTQERRLLRAVALSIAGFTSQLVVILAFCPNILMSLLSGIEVYQAYSPRSPIEEVRKFFVGGVRILLRSWWVLLSCFVLAGFYRLNIPSSVGDSERVDRAVWVFSVSTVLVAAAAGDLARWPWLWAIGLLALSYRQWQVGRCKISLAISFVTLVMPFAYAFGTANSAHLQMAMALPIIGVWMTSYAIALNVQQRLNTLSLAGSFLLFGLLVTAIQTRGWVIKQANYRLDTAAAQQVHWLPLNPGVVRLRVDQSMVRDIDSWIHLTRSAGMPRGVASLEFTGQAPGLLALQAARPLGFLWLVGGGPFNGDAATAAALRNVTAEEVAGAWLVSSDDSDRRVHTWREQITGKLGGFPYEMAGQTQISDPTSPDALKRITVTLWRPVVTSSKQ